MARLANYDKKIELIQNKIDGKAHQLKDLKEELKQLRGARDKEYMQEVTKFMQDRNISAAEVLATLKEKYPLEQ